MTRVAIELRHVHELFGGDFAPVVEYVKRADEKGIDQVIIADHVALHRDAPPRYPGAGFPPLDYPWYDPIAILSGLATVTRRIRLSTGILIAPLRPAPLLAKQLATLDVLSRGRLDAGFGVGWQHEEFDASNIPFENRFLHMEEQVLACRELWKGGPSSFHGKTVRFDDLYCSPRPFRPQGIPIWLGFTATPKAFERIVRYGDGWIRPDPDPERFGGHVRELRALCAARGRDPKELTMRAQVTQALGPDGRPDIAATLARAPAYVEAGADIIEFYPGRICRSADELDPLLDAIMDVKRRLNA